MYNDQDHRAGGPMRVNVEQLESVNEGEDDEKPKDERAPNALLCRIFLQFEDSIEVQQDDRFVARKLVDAPCKATRAHENR